MHIRWEHAKEYKFENYTKTKTRDVFHDTTNHLGPWLTKFLLPIGNFCGIQCLYGLYDETLKSVTNQHAPDKMFCNKRRITQTICIFKNPYISAIDMLLMSVLRLYSRVMACSVSSDWQKQYWRFLLFNLFFISTFY